MQRDELSQLLRKVGALLGHTPTESILRQHGVAQMVHLERLPEGFSIRADSPDRGATVVHTVVALLAANKTGLCRLAF